MRPGQTLQTRFQVTVPLWIQKHFRKPVSLVLQSVQVVEDLKSLLLDSGPGSGLEDPVSGLKTLSWSRSWFSSWWTFTRVDQLILTSDVTTFRSSCSSWTTSFCKFRKTKNEGNQRGTKTSFRACWFVETVKTMCGPEVTSDLWPLTSRRELKAWSKFNLEHDLIGRFEPDARPREDRRQN